MKELMKQALLRKKGEGMSGLHIDIVLPGEHEKEEADKEAKEEGLAPMGAGTPRLEDDMHEKAEMAGLPVKEGDLSDPHEKMEAMGKHPAEMGGHEEEVGKALLGGEEKDQRGSMLSLRDKVKAGIRHGIKK